MGSHHSGLLKPVGVRREAQQNSNRSFNRNLNRTSNRTFNRASIRPSNGVTLIKESKINKIFGEIKFRLTELSSGGCLINIVHYTKSMYYRECIQG